MLAMDKHYNLHRLFVSNEGYNFATIPINMFVANVIGQKRIA